MRSSSVPSTCRNNQVQFFILNKNILTGSSFVWAPIFHELSPKISVIVCAQKACFSQELYTKLSVSVFLISCTVGACCRCISNKICLLLVNFGATVEDVQRTELHFLDEKIDFTHRGIIIELDSFQRKEKASLMRCGLLSPWQLCIKSEPSRESEGQRTDVPQS